MRPQAILFVPSNGDANATDGNANRPGVDDSGSDGVNRIVPVDNDDSPGDPFGETGEDSADSVNAVAKGICRDAAEQSSAYIDACRTNQCGG